MKIIVAQYGARRAYFVPRIIQNLGMLERMFTDICAVKGWPAVARRILPKWQPKPVRRLFGRVPNGIPAEKITCFSNFGLSYVIKRMMCRDYSASLEIDMECGKKFCNKIIACGVAGVDAVHTFNNYGLELLKHAKSHGMKTFMEQTIAPMKIEHELLKRELELFPEFASVYSPNPATDAFHRFIEREEEEWKHADTIIAGSDFVVQAIRDAGGPADRAVAIPYGIDTSQFLPVRTEISRKDSLNVLFVGEVGLRKGAHYLLAAARLLEQSAKQVKIRFVGNVALPASMLKDLPGNVEMVGQVPRAEIISQFAWADAFCLPSLCEGSAIVTYEAISMGIPVICTPNTGSVVSDGVEGIIVPIRDPRALAEAVIRLLDSPSELEAMMAACLSKRDDLSLEAYGRRLGRVFSSCRVNDQ